MYTIKQTRKAVLKKRKKSPLMQKETLVKKEVSVLASLFFRAARSNKKDKDF